MRGALGLASVGLVLAASGCTLPFEEGVPGCESFSDDFEDGVTDGFWLPNSFEEAPSGYGETDGALVLTLAPDAPGSYFSGYLSNDLDFTNRSARLRLLEAPNPATNAQATFKIEIPYPYVAMFILEAGQLRVRVETESFADDLRGVPYDPRLHRFLRLRHRDDVLYFDTSADGSEWMNLASRPMLAVNRARIGIGGGTYQAETVPGVARFDDFVAACR